MAIAITFNIATLQLDQPVAEGELARPRVAVDYLFKDESARITGRDTVRVYPEKATSGLRAAIREEIIKQLKTRYPQLLGKRANSYFSVKSVLELL